VKPRSGDTPGKPPFSRSLKGCSWLTDRAPSYHFEVLRSAQRRRLDLLRHSLSLALVAVTTLTVMSFWASIVLYRPNGGSVTIDCGCFGVGSDGNFICGLGANSAVPPPWSLSLIGSSSMFESSLSLREAPYDDRAASSH
jgi:hypothetical protein